MTPLVMPKRAPIVLGPRSNGERELVLPPPGPVPVIPSRHKPVGAEKIKLVARDHILAVFPAWKQANMTARSVDLTRAGLAGNLTAGEQAEEAAILAAWDWVKSVRTYSDTMEAAYEAAEDKQGFDYMAGWPNFHMEEPVPVEIPEFLLEPEVPEAVEEPAPEPEPEHDPPETVPEALLDLVQENEAYSDTKTRLWSLYLELNGKLMLNLASPEEIALHSRLHNELHWIAPPIEGEA
jgi:hypothetical protein